MERFVTGAMLALSVLAAAIPASAAVGVRAGGGVAYVAYGDFNDYVRYVNDEVLAPAGVTGTMGEIHWVGAFSAELVMPLAPAIELGVGAGVVSGSSAFTFASAGNTFDYEHTMRSFPFTATIYVLLPQLPFAKAHAFGGGGAYYTKLAFDESVEESGVPDGFEADLSAWGFGLHGGAGLSFAVAPTVSLDLDVTGRWASVSGFSGTAAHLDGTTDDVFLASYVDAVDGRVFGPEPAAYKGVYDEGSVDLSGVAFTLALRVAF